MDAPARRAVTMISQEEIQGPPRHSQQGLLRKSARSPSNSQVSGPSSEEPGTAPFVKEQQSRAALLLVVLRGNVGPDD